MKCDEAAGQSEFKMALLTTPVSDKYEVYDFESNGFFIAVGDNDKGFMVDRKLGRGSRSKNDWKPVTSNFINDAIRSWQASNEDRDVVIRHPWQKACEESPVKSAKRAIDNGLWMIRNENKDTWMELTNSQIVRVQGVFKQYDNWTQIHIGEKYSDFDWTNKYYSVTKAIAKKKKKSGYTSPDAPSIDVPIEVINAGAQVAMALATAIGHTQGEQQAELIAELKRMSGHVSWHLREDRGKYR